jgi:hypothetical protein
MDLIIEFNELSKSGLGVEIGHFCVKIQLLSHRKTSKITTFRKNRKNLKFDILTFFHWKFHFKSFLTKINRNQSKNMQILRKKFDFSEKSWFCWFFDEKEAVSWRRPKTNSDSKTRFGKNIRFYYEIHNKKIQFEIIIVVYGGPGVDRRWVTTSISV